VRAMILRSPYTSIADVAQLQLPYLPARWLVRDKFDSFSKIGVNKAPLFVFHGANDTLIPLALGRELFEQANEPKTWLTIDGAGHGFRGEELERANNAMLSWFREHLAPKPAQRLAIVADHGPSGEVVAMEWPSGKELWTIPNNRGHDVQLLAKRRKASRLRNSVRSAYVVRTRAYFGMVRMFQTLNDHPQIEIRIFAETEEAEAWLREEES